MKLSTKILASILGLGIFYSFYKLFTGTGGGGLGDFFDVLGYTSIILCVISLFILLINLRNFKRHIDTFVFFLIGLPMTVMATGSIIENISYIRPVDLTPKYLRPVNETQYVHDSSTIKLQIDSLIALRNRETGGTDIISSFIDTIIYSQSGDKIFISYVRKFAENNLGNDLDPAYLYAESKDSAFWNLEEGTPNAYIMSGSYHDTASLKKAVRHFYFKRYSFLDKDSTKKNYFWRNGELASE